LVFERGFSRWAVPFDAEALQVKGEAFPLNQAAGNVGGSSQYARLFEGSYELDRSFSAANSNYVDGSASS